MRLLSTISAGLTLAAASAFAAPQQPQAPQAIQPAWTPVHVALGQAFATWREFLQSPLFVRGGLRCLTPSRAQQLAAGYGNNILPGDCDANSTNPLPVYSPANVDIIEIDVVFHVLQATNGQGNVSNALIQSQIDILNEDYRALPGTLGAPGVDTKIQFRLATLDPAGNPTTGITRTTNNNWYNDVGNYWSTLAWDTRRYLNIYTNQASGALGYVPGAVPFGGAVGTTSDRVVGLWSAVGRNAPIGPPYNQGRTLTHEVGHYLGLYHTFDGGCGTSSCNTTGDLICDTNPESTARFGCPTTATSCGSLDPVRNYMDYTDDACMNNFTEQQARRMRCVLENWRPMLGHPLPPTLGTNYCTATTNSTGLPGTLQGNGSRLVANNNFGLVGIQLPLNSNGYFITSQNQTFVANAGGGSGNLCVGAPSGRFITQIGNSGIFGQIGIVINLTQMPQPNGPVAVQPGETWNFQLWYRDSILGFPTSNFTDGYTVMFQ